MLRNAPEFDVEQFLAASGDASRILLFARSAVIFAQGDPGRNVLYIQRGSIKVSVVSPAGREAIIGIAGPKDFLGEGCLTGQPRRLETATAISPTSVRVVDKSRMARLLRREPAFADWFIRYMIGRSVGLQADLIDQLFNSSEKRLARALLVLARHAEHDEPHDVLPNVSQEMLAEMVGTTRSRVNLLMSRFRKLGVVEYRGGLRVNTALLTGLLEHPYDRRRLPARPASESARPPRGTTRVRRG